MKIIEDSGRYAYEEKIKQYTAVLLTVTMSLPGTMAYGNVDSLMLHQEL